MSAENIFVIFKAVQTFWQMLVVDITRRVNVETDFRRKLQLLIW